MKLKKREITLNEADSLKDMFYLERMLLNAYGERSVCAFRKETENELQTLEKQTAEEKTLLEKLLKKSKAEGLS